MTVVLAHEIRFTLPFLYLYSNLDSVLCYSKLSFYITIAFTILSNLVQNSAPEGLFAESAFTTKPLVLRATYGPEGLVARFPIICVNLSART